MNIMIFGLSITSSWGNGHATTYRSLVKGLWHLGHKVTFLEKDQPWYASNRDMPESGHCRIILYNDFAQIMREMAKEVQKADLVIVGSFVDNGIEVGSWILDLANGITAFYDIDTPVTLAKMAAGDYQYLSPSLIPRYDLYLSFTGGPVLEELEDEYHAKTARQFFCSVDSDLYSPCMISRDYELGYMGTFSPDRQDKLDKLMLTPARSHDQKRFIVAGPQYPEDIQWPANVERVVHIPPGRHSQFYCSQKMTLNITRTDMIKLGHSPSVRMFEAAACCTPVITDYWPGLEMIFEPEKEILVANDSDDVQRYMTEMTAASLEKIAANALAKVIKHHNSTQRAGQLIDYYRQIA
ncbi:MAG: glycosyltransferase [Planctomycetes bacterium GWF2_50_10]|nr:MAG: glycosyltransferase [Planctomycetes bacterium GWF2_50_10]